MNRNTKRRALPRLVVVLLALGGLVLSTTASPARAQKAHDRVTLTLWTNLSDPLSRSLLEPYFRQFEKSEPGVTIKFVSVPVTNNYVKYTTAIAAGRGPDVILTPNFNPIPGWAANSLIQPLDPWYKQMNVSSTQWFPWVWQMQSFHGRIWTFAQEYDTALFVWNKDAFKKAGLDPNRPPRTIAEMDTYAKKLTKFDSKGHLVQAGIVPWSNEGSDPRFWTTMFGGSLYDSVHHKYTLNDPANVRAFDWMGTYAKMLGGADKANGFLKGFTGNADPLYTGQVAMEVVGDWIPLFTFKPYAPHLNYGVARIPVASGVPYGTNIVLGSDMFVLPSGAHYPKQAAQLMLYMMRSAPVLAWCVGEANVPPTQAAAFSSSFVHGVPYMSGAVETARGALKNPALLRPYPTSTIYDYVSGQLTTAMQQVQFSKMSGQAALSQVQQLAEQYLTKVKRDNPDWYSAGD